MPHGRRQPELLEPLARKNSRPAAAGDPLLFEGLDLWNCYEITWLEPGGKPVARIGRITYPADTPYLIESKSLKLYLASLSGTTLAGAAAAAEIIRSDLNSALQTSACRVELLSPDARDFVPAHPVGVLLDTLDALAVDYEPNSNLLAVSDTDEAAEVLASHLLRTLCPRTGQPDIGTVLVAYRGPRIIRENLLRYIISFRQHRGFHESCCELMFLDILKCCRPAALSVTCCYTRRGGIDINPVRHTPGAQNLMDYQRLIRQ